MEGRRGFSVKIDKEHQWITDSSLSRTYRLDIIDPDLRRW